ncbi:MAG: hypothetical protein JWN04_3879, partial [Myxococcaceae bacterium]|nr:hypothetical protein [Myxococcaceae bacterium]
GNVLAVKAYPQPALALDDIALRLRGGASDVIFAGDTGQQVGLAARVHLAYFAGDASLEPVSIDDLGMSLVDVGPTYAPLSEGSLADVDCDGLLEPYDSTDDSMVTAIDASPSAVTSVFSGDPVTLSARILRGAAGASGTWTLLDTEGATLTPVAAAPDSRVFQASSGGRYLVSFRTPGTGARLEHIFAIDVIDRVTASAPPTCNPSKELDTGRVGEAIALTAVVSDDDSPVSALTVQWGLIDSLAATPTLTPASTILVRGDKALFSPLDAGNYTIGCRAFDGMSYGPIGQVDLSVVARQQNRAPDDLVLSPMTSMVPPGGTVVSFHAYARDVDGDALSFVWDVKNAVALGEPVTQGRESVLQVQTDASGVVKVQVSVSDDKAPPVVATAVIVVGDAPVTTVDADHDGWPAGTGPAADCNDMDPNVHPRAVDVCGDAVDSDCDGTIEVLDCDADGYTTERGDCDDTDRTRHPGAFELCDGIDNDCNQIVDDRFSVGKACAVGVGSCQNSGVLQCSADGMYALCTVSPSMPTQEVCDGIDNDCDGAIDNGVCVSDPAGVPDAGVASDAGVVVVDSGEAGTQQCVYSGPELCADGLDNDCDGAIDYKDIDCQTKAVAGDSCATVQTLVPNTYVDGTLDGAALDFSGSCTGKATADVVYSFVMDGNGVVQVGFQGVQPSSWSIWTGTCDSRASKLVEQFCGTDTNAHDLAQGQYFLVLQGVGGAYKASVQAAYK